DQLSDAWNNRGVACSRLGLWAMAEDSFERSLALLPQQLEPHMARANMYCAINRLEEAEAADRKAIAHDPGLVEAHGNPGITLLGLGRWEEGWREYEWRWKNTLYPPKAFRFYPKWEGEDLSGKTIVLFPEQGYGDEIKTLRFASEVAGRWPESVVILQAR